MTARRLMLKSSSLALCGCPVVEDGRLRPTGDSRSVGFADRSGDQNFLAGEQSGGRAFQ